MIAWGAIRLVHLLAQLPLSHWGTLTLAGGLTLGRVLVSTAVGTAWAVPAGLAIGLSPMLSRLLQPVAQVMASFPAPMLFPVAIALFHAAGLGLGTGQHRPHAPRDAVVHPLQRDRGRQLRALGPQGGRRGVPDDAARALLDALPARRSSRTW